VKRIIVFLAIANCVIASAQANPTTLYHLTDLGTLGGGTKAYGINASGEVVGASYTETSNNTQHAFVYRGGKMSGFGTFGGAESIAFSINASGQFAGYANTFGYSESHAFLYSNGVMNDLGTLGGDISVAYGINSSGQVVGFSKVSGSNYNHAFLYSGGVMHDLNPLGAIEMIARGINDAGDIVGYGDIGSGNRAFIYSAGSFHYLGTLNGGSTYPTAINAFGQVVGSASAAQGERAFLYSGGVMTDLGSLYGYTTNVALGINAAGHVVGTSESSNRDRRVGFLYQDGGMLDLNTLLDNSGYGWTIVEAGAINDSGWIAATVYQSNGPSHAILLKPVPEPSSLVLGVFAAIASVGLTVLWQLQVRVLSRRIDHLS